MGLLQQGRWVDRWYDTSATGGAFNRQDSAFRGHVVAPEDYQAADATLYPAESGRYHLYVSLACPWAHRTLLFRVLKELESHIDITVVEPIMLENGWEFGVPLDDMQFLYELYLRADPAYEGRVTVPVLWDKHTQTIVSNESADIIRMLNNAFDEITGNTQDFYPDHLRTEIDEVNERIYNTVNNGVYKAGFATTQQAYEAAVYPLFDTLDWLEERLSQQAFLVGDYLTEADWRLFTTLVRFDAVYFGHFKTNIRRIQDYANISAYLRQLYQVPGIADTVNFDHIKQHYYASHTMINPTQVVPVGPALDLLAPHGRGNILVRGAK